MIPLSRILLSPQINFEPYGINPFNLFFHNPNVENEYRSTTLRVTIAHMRFSLFSAIVLIAAYGVLDPFIFWTSSSLLHLCIYSKICCFTTTSYIFLFHFISYKLPKICPVVRYYRNMYGRYWVFSPCDQL